MRKRKLRLLAARYACETDRARIIGAINRARIDLAAARAGEHISRSYSQARKVIEEQSRQTRAKANELEQLVNELVKGE